jgi:elongation factor Ts
MAEITAALVKELRQKTGAGMMDCKKALTETGGDLEESVDLLRKKGITAAEKKAGRVAVEGLVGVTTEGTRGALVEVNSETDFVARNETFQDFVNKVTRLALDTGGNLEALGAANYPGGASVKEALTELTAKIGENLGLRRSGVLQVSQGVVAAYVHNQVAPGLGKIGVLVALESAGDADKLAAFGKQLAMHVAAAAPQVVSTEDADATALERERNILAEQARASGKPEEIVEKMVEGRLRKYYEEICLLEQTFVIDNEFKVRQAIEAAGKDAGAPIAVTGFHRFQIGEGIERE